MATTSLPVPPRDSLEHSVREVAVGDVLDDKWEILRKLGEGGMGTVVLARERELQRLVAVKVLAQHLCKDPHAVARFEREARLTAQLEHPHIVPVYAVGRFHERPFMVMKYLEGSSLSEKLRARPGPWPWAEARPLVEPLCKALSFLHQRQLVHRDVKPSNVIVGNDGHVTLLDFGILKESSKDVTTTGMALGTLGWMAPEQVVPGGHVDARADTYALGAILYRLLAGRAPFVGEEAVIAQHKLRGDPPHPTELNPRLPGAVAAVLFRAVRKDPARRYAAAEELLTAVDAAYAQPDLPAPPPAAVPRWLLTLGAALIVLAIGSVAFAAWRIHERRLEEAALEANSLAAPVAPTPAPSATAATAPAPPPTAPPAPVEPPQEPPAPSHSAPPHHASAKVPKGHVARSPEPSTPKGSAEPLKVSLVSRVGGKSSYAELFIDGKPSGETPASVELSPGVHHIRLVRDGFQTYDQRLDFGQGRNERVVIDLHP